jgi:hypothetical protein
MRTLVCHKPCRPRCGTLGAGFRVNNNLRIHGTATNVLDQKRFQLYGGSVIGRRVLGGLTANF